MTEQIQAPEEKKRSWLKLIGKGLGYFFAILIVVGIIGHYYWKQSGDGQWKYETEVNGTKVYTLKEPGEVYLKVKMNGVFRGSLSAIMKVMRDPAACEDVGCYDYNILKEEAYPRYIYYTFKYPWPAPFKDRHYVVKSEFFQDADTKAIYVDFKKTDQVQSPPGDCCVTVDAMHNIWQFKPLGEGKVEVEFIMFERPGGMFPYPMFNAYAVGEIATNVPLLQEVLDMKKYTEAVVDYVEEYGK